MKFLIFGCNGMAGHVISLYLKEQGHDVLGFARSKSNLVNSAIGDALDDRSVRKIIGMNRFDCIINSIGILNQSAEDNKAQAVYINSYFPHFLADLTDGTSTQIIHMSTDCVFSGVRGKYCENDLKDGESFYDRSKALGELEDKKNMTIRSSIIGPDINRNGIGLMNWFMQQKNNKVSGYTKAIWTGQTSLQLAKTMEAVALERANGLYNMVPDESISKYDLLKLINKYCCNGRIDIEAAEGVVVDKSLKRTRWEFSYKIPDYERMISELAGWMENYKYLYPHYYQCGNT